MDSRDDVGPTAVQAAVVPARAVYLVADGSEGGLRRAVQEACTRWGGMTEPIVPVKSGGEIDPWWQRVVSTVRADSAVNVDADPVDAAKVAEALGLGLVPLADIDHHGLAAFTVHPNAVGPGELPGPNAYVMASEKRKLWEVVGAGDLTDQHLGSLRAGTFYTRRPHQDEVARAQLSGWTLVERTCSQFAEHWARGLESGPAVVWVTEPGSFADCISFWNLRALRPLRYGSLPMLLLPVGQVQYWLNFAAELGHILERPDQFEPDVAVCSLAVSDADLHKTASDLELQHHEGEPRSDMPGQQPRASRRLPICWDWMPGAGSLSSGPTARSRTSTCSCSVAPPRFASPRPLSSGLEGQRWCAYQERCWTDCRGTRPLPSGLSKAGPGVTARCKSLPTRLTTTCSRYTSRSSRR